MRSPTGFRVKKAGALLRRVQGKWEIMVCGGDGLMDLSTLIDAGIAKQTASGLVAQLNKAEQSISAERGRRFGLFGTPDDPRMPGYHGHHIKKRHSHEIETSQTRAG